LEVDEGAGEGGRGGGLVGWGLEEGEERGARVMRGHVGTVTRSGPMFCIVDQVRVTLLIDDCIFCPFYGLGDLQACCCTMMVSGSCSASSPKPSTSHIYWRDYPDFEFGWRDDRGAQCPNSNFLLLRYLISTLWLDCRTFGCRWRL
jgi:hypothetical protein